MQAKTLKVGMIGAGGIGRVHMETFAKTEGAEIVAVTDVNREAAEKAAKEYGIARVHDSAEKLIEDPDLDAVIIGVPNKWHAPLAVKALQANKHVLLEKPMAINLDSAKQIVRKQQESGKIVMISHQMRWEWLAQKVREQTEKGELGRIYSAKAGWFRRKGIPGWGTWFTKKAESGGGPLIDIGVHMLDLSLYLMGNPKPMSVTGAVYAEFGPRKRGIGTWGKPNWDGYFDVEDLATAWIRMEDGSTLTLEVSWAVHMDTTSRPFIHLMGTEGGVALYGNERGKFLTERFDNTVDIDLVKPDDDEGARIRMSRHFLECIRDGKEPLTSVKTGYTNNLILDAIYRSSQLGKEIQLDWDLE